MKIFRPALILACLSLLSSGATPTWTGNGDGGSFYQEANWQTEGGEPIVGNPLAPNVAINEDLIFSGHCPAVEPELVLGASLSIVGGSITTSSNGVSGGEIFIDGGGELNTQWISSSKVTLKNGAITLRGGAVPLAGNTTIACSGIEWRIHFTNKLPAQANADLQKITIDGAPAVAGGNCDLASDGQNGTIATVPLDSDSDGLPDAWEMRYFGNLEQTASGDPDGDGLSNLEEFQRGTDPTLADTDGDGLSDKVETNTGVWVSPQDTGTDPLSADTDGDGLPDGVETRTGVFVDGTDTGTDPLLFNSSGGRLGDGAVVRRGGDPTNPASQANAPNVIFIMADDLGYNHLSSYGMTRLSTPRIDSLAATGMRFTSAYAGAAVCGPSRSSLMTGLHSGHVPYKINNAYVDITDRTPTVAEYFKKGGYMTGAFGKWGLGGLGSGQTPLDRGFDRFYGMLDQGHGHTHYPRYLFDDNQRVDIGNTTTDAGITSSNPAHRVNHTHDLFTQAALDFIDHQKDRAFFCYLAFTLPHTEIIATPNAAEEFAAPPSWGTEGVDYNNYTASTFRHVAQPKPHTHFAAELRMIDQSVGAIIDKLNELGIADNTLIIFTSDNGGQLQSVWGSAPSIFFGNNGVLRAGKQDSYEGGLRVPFLASWPGKIPAGTTSDLPIYFADFLPTISEIVEIPAPAHTDGLSFLPTLTGHDSAQKVHPFLFWTHHWQTLDHAVRAGKWKAVKRGKQPIELYDLENDIGETANLAAMHPEIVAEMQTIIDREYTPDLNEPGPSARSIAYPDHPPVGAGNED